MEEYTTLKENFHDNETKRLCSCCKKKPVWSKGGNWFLCKQCYLNPPEAGLNVLDYHRTIILPKNAAIAK